MTGVNGSATTGAGGATSTSLGISDDGRFAAYLSTASNYHAYLYDAATGVITEIDQGRPLSVTVSSDTFPSLSYDTSPDALGISDDGRFVVFSAEVSGVRQAFLYDRLAGTSTLISHDSVSASTPGNANSFQPVVSANGGYVAFTSQASDLRSDLTGPTSGSDVYLYNVTTGTITLVTHASDSPTTRTNGRGVLGSPPVGGPLVIDDDGSYLAYSSPATNLAAGQKLNLSGTTQDSIFEYSRATNTNTLVSHKAGPGNDTTVATGDATNPVIDSNGSLVAYQSTGTDLVPNQMGPPGFASTFFGIPNIFVWDRETGTNVLASGEGGSYTRTGNAPSFKPVLSRHSLPFFSSNATDLVTGAQGTTNAFVNTIIQAHVTLGPITIPDGTQAGTVVGTFTITIDQGPPGQLRLPTFRFDPIGGDNGYFSITPVSTSAPATLVLQVTANQAVKGTYAIGVDVDLGLGDLLVNPFTLTVTGGSNPPPPPPPPPSQPPQQPPPPPQQPAPTPPPGGFESISAAFDPSGQEVTIAVQQDGSLVLTFAGQATVVPGTFRSASVAFSSSGQGMLAITEQDGTLILADATGPHVIPGSFQSASVAFSPSGQVVLAITEQDGTLILADSSGPHVIPGGFQSASVAFSPSGQEVFAVVLGDGTLLVADASGPHTEPGRFRSASLVFDPFGREVLSSIRDDGSEVQF